MPQGYVDPNSPEGMGLVWDEYARWRGGSGRGGWVDPNEQPNDLGYRTVWTMGGGRSGAELIKNNPQTVSFGGGRGLGGVLEDIGEFAEDPGGSWWDAVESIFAEGGDAPSTPEEIIAPIVTPPPVEPPPIEPIGADPIGDIPDEILDPLPPYIPGGPAPPPPGVPGAALSAMPAARGIMPAPGKGTGAGTGGVGAPQNINALHNYYNLFGHLGVVGPGKYNALLE